MKQTIRKCPIPACGLMLGLAALGNLLAFYGQGIRYLVGAPALILLMLLTAKAVMFPASIREGFANPAVAGVMAAYAMSITILSTYLAPFSQTAGRLMWFTGMLLHAVMIICFIRTYLLKFNIKKVFPSYFVMFVGIIAGSVTAPVFGLQAAGQLIFWAGFVTYLILIPVVLYRIYVIGQVPVAAVPTIAILAAPASLSLAGYLNSFPEKSMMMISLLTALSLLMFVLTLSQMPGMMKNGFSPAYSSFTFPFVISATAIKGSALFLTGNQMAPAFITPLARVMELWALVMVLFVLLSYIRFMFPRPAETGVPAA
jgi:exfoliative toxin A/B